jgi:hypothetical protein
MLQISFHVLQNSLSRVEGRRNASGKVDSIIDRRNNEDMLWKKVS